MKHSESFQTPYLFSGRSRLSKQLYNTCTRAAPWFKRGSAKLVSGANVSFEALHSSGVGRGKGWGCGWGVPMWPHAATRTQRRKLMHANNVFWTLLSDKLYVLISIQRTYPELNRSVFIFEDNNLVK